MMASMNSSCTDQQPSPINNDIRATIDGEVQKKINSILEIFVPHLDGESVLVLFWAPKEIGDKISVLTTAACMPFHHFGNNKELLEYGLACLGHILYVYRDAKEEAAFGLAGRAYLYCSPQQIQTVNANPEDQDQRPPCKNAIFNNNWGSFAVPVVDANKRVCVLEFVMDTHTPLDYTNEISVVQRLLKDAGLQTSIQMDHTKRNYLHPKKMIRKSKSFDKTRYCHLVPLFGMSRARAEKILKLKPGTFTNVCRRVGIPEWPCIRNTTSKASSVPKTRIRQTVSKTTSFVTPNAILISIQNEGFRELPPEQSMAVIPSAKETQTNQIAIENSVNSEDLFDLERDLTVYTKQFNEKENQDNNIAPAMDIILDSMYIDHCSDDMNSIPDEESLESTPRQTMITNFDAWLAERDGPGDFLLDLGEREYLDNNVPSTEYLDTMINELLAA